MHNYSRDWMNQPVFQFDPWSPNKPHRTEERSRCSNKPLANQFGHLVVRDETGTITEFQYDRGLPMYSFEYESDGSVAAIERSDGWTWRKVNSDDFIGWVVRNYFETWSVPAEECGAVLVDDNGLKVTGLNPELIGLPSH